MKLIKVKTIGEYRCVTWNEYTIKKFSVYDDYAYTRASAYADYISKHTQEQFMDKFPEYFLWWVIKDWNDNRIK